MMVSGESPSAHLPPEAFRRPTSFCIWGEDRTTVNQLVFHVARLGDPEFIWVDIVASGDPVGLGDPGASALIPESRRVPVGAKQLKPSPGRKERRLRRRAMLDPTDRRAQDLNAVLQLPRLVTTLLGRPGPADHPRVIAVANSDRVAEYYPEGKAKVRRFIQSLQRMNITLVAGYCGPVRRDLHAWDHLFRLTSEPTDGAAIPGLRCEKGPTGPAWEVGTSVTLANFDDFSATVEELEGTPPVDAPLAFMPALSGFEAPNEAPPQ